jgi:trypsin
MRKLTALLATLGAALAIGVGTASAILGGDPDNGRHPWVGLVSFHDASGVPLWRCSGSLIDKDTFLTASHCAGPSPDIAGVPAKAVIWFGEGPIEITNGWTPGTSCTGFTGYPCTGDAAGRPIPHPGWTGEFTVPNTHDIGVVQLSAPVTNRGYGTLAPAGYVDRLIAAGKKPDFAVVGYGLQQAKPVQVGVRQRLLAIVTLKDATSPDTRGYGIRIANKKDAGICFGDSGGPVLSFDGTKEVIVAVSSFVQKDSCKGGAYGFRTDTAESRGFLASYTRLP